MAKEIFYKVRIRSLGRIPFINRNGPINIPISLSSIIVENLRKIGIQVDIVETVETDSKGEVYPNTTKSFKTGDIESSVKTDSGKGDDVYLDRSKVVLPEGTHEIESLSTNVSVKTTAVPEPIETLLDEVDQKEDKVVEETHTETVDEVENVDEPIEEDSDIEEETVEEEKEAFRMKVYNDYYKMNATELRNELEAIAPEVKALTGKDIDTTATKKNMLETVKQLIAEING
ncbi:hypothetical protein [Proteus mirabilis]|uniref:hypothetical protein n=1 Tax=Proteus mirabilis TaxID=584 RepID=UPI0034D52A54